MHHHRLISNTVLSLFFSYVIPVSLCHLVFLFGSFSSLLEAFGIYRPSNYSLLAKRVVILASEVSRISPAKHYQGYRGFICIFSLTFQILTTLLVRFQ